MAGAQYAILRFAKYKGPTLSRIETHNERTKEAYASNPDIDTQRSKLNFHPAKPKGKYRQVSDQIIRESGCRVRKDSVTAVEVLITASPEFFEGKKPREVKEFFDYALEFMKSKQDESTYISAVVHVDEKTPHMHLCFVPLTPDNRLSAKTIIGNKKKLTQWQDEFHAHMVKKYPDFERGESASSTGRVHLPPRQYKAAVQLTAQREALMDKIRSVTVFNMKSLLPEIMADMDKYIRGAEGFKTQLVKVSRKNKDLESEVAALEQQLESETKSILQELQEKQRLLELEEKERKLQNIPQEIIDRYNSSDSNIKKVEDIAYE